MEIGRKDMRRGVVACPSPDVPQAEFWVVCGLYFQINNNLRVESQMLLMQAEQGSAQQTAD